MPSEEDMKLVEEAEGLVNEFAKTVDAFYISEWPAYQKQVEAAKLNWFRE